jgi:hypothetical protein
VAANDRVADFQRNCLIPSDIGSNFVCDSTAGGRPHRGRLSIFKQKQFRLGPVHRVLLVVPPHFSGTESSMDLFDAL